MNLRRPTLLAFALTTALGCTPGSSSASPPPATAHDPGEPAAASGSTPPAAKQAVYQSGIQGDASLFTRLPEVAELAVKSVVNISSTKVVRQGPNPFSEDPFFRRFFGQRGMPRERRAQSLGSGVIVDARKGVLLTNNHVVADAEDIKVALSDDREYDAEVVGTDPSSDLAVIRLKDPPKDLEALSFGDSGALRLGEAVLAIGNPFGVGQTVTLGIVSATGRANVGIVDYEDFIQTDAAINPGNSGGALVNMQGQLVGINTAILSRSGGYQGIGCAIPSNMARALMDDLLDDGRVSRGFLGVFIQDLTADLAKVFEVEQTSGVVVSDVMEDGPADQAGIRAGDIILQVDGKPVDSAARLRLLIAAKGGDRKVDILALRDGKKKKMKVTLGEKDKRSGPQAGREPEAEVGLRLAPLTPEVRERFRIEDTVRSGVVVLAIEPASPAARAGLQTGDVIVEVDRAPVKSPGAVQRRLTEGEDDVLIRVIRRGSSLFLVLNR